MMEESTLINIMIFLAIVMLVLVTFFKSPSNAAQGNVTCQQCPDIKIPQCPNCQAICPPCPNCLCICNRTV